MLLPSQSDSDEPVQLGQPLSDTHLEVRDHVTGAVIETGCGEMFVGEHTRLLQFYSSLTTICMISSFYIR